LCDRKLHDEEVPNDAALVRRLVAEQFPRSTATVNAIYRLGDHLYARLPRVRVWARDLDKEWRWLPKLAPRLSLRVPKPVGMGYPASSYPIYLQVDRRPAVFG
jgi:aminoglycoside phosphotransferase (APT) family kinase protein